MESNMALNDEIDYSIPDDDGQASEDDLMSEINQSLSELSLSESEMSCRDLPNNSLSWHQQVEIIHTRKFVNQLERSLAEKNTQMENIKNELDKCRVKIQELEVQRDSTFEELDNASHQTNNPATNRLHASHQKLCQELQNEQLLEAEIEERLINTEYEFYQAQMDLSKVLLTKERLETDEVCWQKNREESAETRIAKEIKYAQNSEINFKKTQRQKKKTDESLVQTTQDNYEKAKKIHAKANHYFKQTINKIKKENEDRLDTENKINQKRMESTLALKKDIQQNRENLRAQKAKSKSDHQKEENKLSKHVNEILKAGGNPARELIRENVINEFQRKKSAFKEAQKNQQLQLSQKILQQEARMTERKKQHPQLYPNKQEEKNKVVKPHPQKHIPQLNEMMDEYIGDKSSSTNNKNINMALYEKDVDSPVERDYVEYELQARLSDSDLEESPETLAKPEFEGLWNKHKPYRIPKDMHLPKATNNQSSKMEADIIQRVLEKHREGIVKTQVAGGREFQGLPFYSKPDIIHFKDFEVGKVYKKRLVLTNVSYSVNYCKLIGLTERLKDFIDLHFDPPGQMSAGMTCELLVTFRPMINENLNGEVNFLAQTGPFAIPVVCSIKRCDLKVDVNEVDFGIAVIGETLRKTVTLSNSGALGTKFCFEKVTGLKMRRLTTTETTIERESSQFMETVENLNNQELVSSENQNALTPEKDAAESGMLQDRAQSAISEQPSISVTTPALAGILETEDELSSYDGMKVTGTSDGEIEPFNSITLEITWKPTIPGRSDVDFVIKFEDDLSEPITVQATANAIDVPVWVERESVDLKICMYDRLYQDAIIVNNRATSALKLKFNVCKQLQNHLEILPKTGYVQAQSKFSAQLKFLPRKSLFEDAKEFFDSETGVLEVPMIITVADQTKPVPFTVTAVVTTSDLEFDTTNIDFGCATIYESVVSTISLTNKSFLPQQFGFVGSPEFVEVQPNDGFGMILPNESISLDVIFKPPKAKNYSFDLTCKSLINRSFKIHCKGVGVHPPLELSHQIIHFPATTLNDTSTVSINVCNNHLSTNEFTHPVPRIGTGDIVPVGQTSFEFVVPENSPVTVAPSVGTVLPGKKLPVQLRFSPRLSDAAIRKQAVRMITATLEAQAMELYQAACLQQQQQQAEQKHDATSASKKGKPTGKEVKSKTPALKNRGKASDSSQNIVANGPRPITPPTEDSIDPNSNEYATAHASLLKQFEGKFESIDIPCYIASGNCDDLENTTFSRENTLYLKVYCPYVQPQLVVISESGRSKTDFGSVSIGQRVIKPITIHNISRQTIDLTSNILNTDGPFQVLNSLRKLKPDATHTLSVCFTPTAGEIVFQEVLEIRCPNSKLSLTLKGQGVSPKVTLSINNEEHDMGVVLAGEYKEQLFTITNTSSLVVRFSIELDSQSLSQYAKSQALPAFVRKDKVNQNLVGTQNNNGRCVFDCVPIEGSILPQESQEITISFAPDHSSDKYSDGCRIKLFGQEEQHMFRLVGSAKPHIMYLNDLDPLASVDVECLSVVPVHTLDEDAKPPPTSVLLTLRSILKDSEPTIATRVINVGCVRTMAVSQKKPGGKQNGEWWFENTSAISALGFSIEPTKGMLEAGTQKPITFTWKPPTNFDYSEACSAEILCTLRGDVTESYKIMLQGLVLSE